MTLRLKDRELQRKLDELSNGDFSKRLENESQRRFVGVLNRQVISVYYGDFDALANRFSAIFEVDEVEWIQEYNPRAWNEWPNVEPPKNTPMRCEVWIAEAAKGAIFKGITFLQTCLKWDGSTWRHCRDGVSSRDEMFEGEIKRLRFRPWEDPDEEDSK